MGNATVAVVDDSRRTASAKRWARVAIGCVMAKHRSRRGRTVKSIDAVLWERELAEHMSRHPDLQHLPPPVFPRRRSRFLRRLRPGNLLALVTWVFVLVCVTAAIGWLIGWYLI